jgi:hypothetical protein
MTDSEPLTAGSVTDVTAQASGAQSESLKQLNRRDVTVTVSQPGRDVPRRADGAGDSARGPPGRRGVTGNRASNLKNDSRTHD